MRMHAHAHGHGHMQLLNPLEKIIAGIGALGLHAAPPAHEESVKVCARTALCVCANLLVPAS